MKAIALLLLLALLAGCAVVPAATYYDPGPYPAYPYYSAPAYGYGYRGYYGGRYYGYHGRGYYRR